jgi:general L-amino acid transport system permease protein
MAKVETAPAPGPGTRLAIPAQGGVAWARANLFNTWYNALLTVVTLPVVVWLTYSSLRFVFVTGRWEIVEVNLTNFMVGTFPRGELWRPWVAAAILGLAAGVGAGLATKASSVAAEARGAVTSRAPFELLRRATPPLLLVATLVVFVRTATPLVLLATVVVVTGAGFVLGRRLPHTVSRWTQLAIIVSLLVAYAVMTRFGGTPVANWGGFLLTLFLSVAGITLSFPLGVLVALGRRSTLPAVRVVCVVYIEIMRGLPLVALLFMGWLILGFFLPAGFPSPDRAWRALIIFILFTAAYVAEIVRGGLQGVPKGQVEAAQALGLSPWKVTRLIVLPQALRSVIPAMVGQFISLFKDTSLVLVIGLLDLLAVARRVTQQPDYLGQGLHAETLLFVSFVYWVGSYWMSRESQRLETRLGVGER